MSRLKCHTIQPRLKGSKGDVFDIIREYSIGGVCTLSYQDIAVLTGYGYRTVARSLSALIQDDIIRTVKVPREKRNSYEVVNALP